MATPFILFDLDGTLSNPIEGIWRSINFTLSHYGYKNITKEETANFIGPPIDETFPLLTSSTDPNHIEDLVKKYRERYTSVGYSENTLYPGIKESIKTLFDQKIPMGLCTSKRKDNAETILKMFELHDYFSFVSGGDIGIKKYQQIQELLASNVISSGSIMVGDRAVDLISAHKNNIASAGVLWGYGSKEELEEQNPRFILKKPEEFFLLAR